MIDWINRSCVCSKCAESVLAQLTRQVFSDLSEHFLYVCPECGKKGCFPSGQMYLPNEAVKNNLTPEQIKRLPVILPWGVEVCARCGQPGAQNHHWAPHAIFQDSELWPQAPLCLKHHREWHDTIETYYKAKFPKL